MLAEWSASLHKYFLQIGRVPIASFPDLYSINPIMRVFLAEDILTVFTCASHGHDATKPSWNGSVVETQKGDRVGEVSSLRNRIESKDSWQLS